jgi:uncharacterized membrane protein required for colicin V production
MITWVDVLAIVFALGLAALGIWRGFLREILVSLAGIVLGVFAGSLWVTSWGGDWAARLGMDEAVFKGVLGLVSLYLIVLIIGYGSALFLRRRPISLWQRLTGGVAGLLNGLFLAAFTFSYIQDNFLGAATDSVLRTSLVASAMIDWLPVILAGIILVVALAVIAVAIVRLIRFISHLVQEPAAAAAPAAGPAAVSVPAMPAATQPTPPPPPGPTMTCPSCGNTVPADASFCPQCGKTFS